MVDLVTRPPTGQVAYPLVLIEHEEKAGGSAALASFAASEKTGRCFVLDTGDGAADEYASLGDYEILVHDGTWPSMIGQIEAATKAPRIDPALPNVVGIDHGSAIWIMLKNWTDARARRSEKGRKTLESDPDAEVDAPMNLWNDAKARWGKMLHLLRSFDGIGVLLAHGAEVTKVENGIPTRETVWTIEAEKTTEGVASAIIQIRRDPRKATLVGVRALNAADLVPTGGLVLPLPLEGMLEKVVFDILGAGGGFATLSAPQTTEGMPTLAAMAKVLAAVQRANGSLSEAEAKAEAGRLWLAAGLPKGVEEVSGDKVTALLLDIAEGRVDPPAQDPATPPTEPSPGPDASEAPEEPVAQETATEGLVSIMGEELTRKDAWYLLTDSRRPKLVAVAKVENLQATGKNEEILARLIAHFGLTDPLEDPEEIEAAAEALTEAFEGDMNADPSGTAPEHGDADGSEPALIDVPEGWSEGRCLCGEPLCFEPGNQNATIRHLDPTIDANHPAEEPF